MPTARKIAVIFNVTSGIGDPIRRLRNIRELFRRYELDPAFFFAGDSGREIRREIQIALEEGFDIIVAAGGDGTVGAVASQLIGNHATMGILPNGTFNFFAKFIGVKNMAEAVDAIARGSAESIDIGQVNGHTFLNNSTIGIHADVIHEREMLEAEGMRKWFAYPIAAYRRLKKFRLNKNCFTFGDKNFCQKTPLVFIGNNEYPFQVSPQSNRQRITDGQFSIFIANSNTFWKILKSSFKFLIGILKKDEDFTYHKASNLVIYNQQIRINVGIDGEIVELSSPLRYKISPHALRVLFPAKLFFKSD